MTSGIRRMFAFASTTLLLSLLFALPTARSGEKPRHPTVPAALAADGVFTSIDYPGAMMTVGRGINPEGEIAGWYFAADGSQHGYILQNGVFRTIDFPGASATTTDGGPNPKGDVVGNYVDSSSVNHGYLLSRGVFTTIDFPGAAFTQVARYINDRGDIVGWYVDPVGNSHGFVFRRHDDSQEFEHDLLNAPESKGTYISIDVPGAMATRAGGINSEGEIVGSYDDASGTTHGFLLSHRKFTTIDDPNADPTQGGTFAWGISPSDTVVGSYFDSSGNPHAFLLRRGFFHTLVIPPTGHGQAFGINPQGDIVGQHDDANGMIHGFLFTDK
jgi:uncharacterized membrane protein